MKKEFKSKRPGKDLRKGTIIGANAIYPGAYDVMLSGSKSIMRGVSNKTDAALNVNDVVSIGFINANGQMPSIVGGHENSIISSDSIENIAKNAYPWQCKGRDGYNSKRSDYPFVYSAGPEVSWEYSLPTTTANLCVALINDVDYILIGGIDRAICINQNGVLVWETLLPNPGLSGSVYACQGFLSDNKFHSVRGWFYPSGNSISVSIDILNIETGEWLEQRKSTWQVATTAWFSGENFHIKASGNDELYSFPLTTVLPAENTFASTILTKDSGFTVAPPDCLFNIGDSGGYSDLYTPEYHNYVVLGDNTYIATKAGNDTTANKTNRLTVFNQFGNKIHDRSFNTFRQDSDYWIDYSQLPSYFTIHSTTYSEYENILSVNAYQNSEGSIKRIFVYTDHSIGSGNTVYWEENYDPVEYDQVYTHVGQSYNKLYIFNENLVLLNTIVYQYLDSDYTVYMNRGMEELVTGFTNRDYQLMGIDVVIDDGSFDYSILSHLFGSYSPTLSVAIKESGVVSTRPGYVGNYGLPARVYDPNGGFVNYSGQICDNLGNILVDKDVILPEENSDIAAGKNGIYMINKLTGLISKL